MVIGKLTENIELTDSLIELGNKPWRIMAAQEGLSPAHLESRIDVLLEPNRKKLVKGDLEEYYLEVEGTVDAAIASGLISEADRVAKINELWDAPVMYKKELSQYFLKDPNHPDS